MESINDSLSNSVDEVEEEHVNLLDELPQAKQPITSHDKLWAELETLDSDAERAKEVQAHRGFLGTEHTEKLAELRRIQVELAQEMTREESSIGLEHYQELWNMGDPDELYKRLYDDRHFELLDQHVLLTSAKLDEIAAIIDASEISREQQ